MSTRRVGYEDCLRFYVGVPALVRQGVIDNDGRAMQRVDEALDDLRVRALLDAGEDVDQAIRNLRLTCKRWLEPPRQPVEGTSVWQMMREQYEEIVAHELGQCADVMHADLHAWPIGRCWRPAPNVLRWRPKYGR